MLVRVYVQEEWLCTSRGLSVHRSLKWLMKETVRESYCQWRKCLMVGVMRAIDVGGLR